MESSKSAIIRTEAADGYVVRKGDTLWGIAQYFLKDPWQWANIWQANADIANPDLIYPGDRIQLAYAEGRPRLLLTRGNQGRTLKLSPQMLPSSLVSAVPAIPLNHIRSFLNYSQVTSLEQLEQAPYVIAGGQDEVILAPGDHFYTRADKLAQHDLHGIFRKGQVFVDPDNQEVLGHEAKAIGLAKVTAKEQDLAKLNIVKTQGEVRLGDRLLPVKDKPLPASFHPSAPKKNIKAHIIAVMDGVSQVGVNSVVAIDRGEQHDLQPGNVLAIYRAGNQAKDPINGEAVQLPAQKSGLLMVFRVFDRVSYALVMEADRNLVVMDQVQSPV
jgi:LysM repeat protein